MVQLEISNRYQSREGLLKFLRERFGDHINFNITETADGHFKFEAPENLTKVGRVEDMKSACTSFEEPSVSFDTLKEVRTVERCLLPLDPLLTSFMDVTPDLHKLCNVFRDANGKNNESIATVHSAISNFRKEAQSYKTQVLYLHSRCQSTVQSVVDSLNLGYQQLAQSQSQNTLVMVRSAREDSVAIRAITFVTSFYLPFSFVATIFGMNLVDFDSDSHNLLVSKQFWMYFVISIPLTIATLVCWRWTMQAYRQDYLTDDIKKRKDTKTMDATSDMEMV
ncbi:CorA Mg2+ transporter protein [Pyrenophora tritici-repentis]|nr:CorA Mg2+ transporter protein [Pyrenophora tritici-repentis]